jgi:tetratricopeptide (TPR) repeat protein
MPGGQRPIDDRRAAGLRAIRQQLRAGNFQQAAAAAAALQKAAPSDSDILSCLASALLGLGRWEEARKAAERGLRARPDDANLLFQVGMCHVREGRLDEAHGAFNRALALKPGDPLLTAGMADALITAGRYAEALSIAGAVWGATSTHPGLAISLARAAAREGDPDRAAAALRQSLASPEVTPAARVDVLYALAEVLDGAGRYDEAFAAVSEAARGRGGGGDAEAQSREVDALIGAWTPEAIRRLPKGPRTERPLFVLGFWRSGTTLVEQILSSHPRVAGGGELPFVARWVHEQRGGAAGVEPMLTEVGGLTAEAINRFSREYLRVLRGISPGAARVTDKAPGNFLHLGLIAAALPGARVVRCLRDPVDTCLSCLFNLRGRRGFAQDLYSLGRFHRDYERLLDHWRRVVDIPLLEVEYEALVADQAGMSRKLVDFAGLPWDEACLRPHENRRTTQTRSMDQVRRPVYQTSIGRAANYDGHLAPLRRGLAEGAARVPGPGSGSDALSRAMEGLNFPPSVF